MPVGLEYQQWPMDKPPDTVETQEMFCDVSKIPGTGILDLLVLCLKKITNIFPKWWFNGDYHGRK